jgi:hypothetical protein
MVISFVHHPGFSVCPFVLINLHMQEMGFCHTGVSNSVAFQLVTLFI